MSEHGTVHWSELISADPAASVAFFEKVAGWQVSEMPMPEGTYYVCMANGAPAAGIMDVASIGDPNVTPHWMTYIAVSDIDATVAEIPTLGGAVLRPPFDIPNVGRIAIVQDPGKGVVGLMTPAPS